MNVLDQLFDSLVEYDKVAKAEQPEVHNSWKNDLVC